MTATKTAKHWVALRIGGHVEFRFTRQSAGVFFGGDCDMCDLAVEMSPGPYFHDWAVRAAEKDGRKHLSLSPTDQGCRDACIAMREVAIAAGIPTD